MDWCESVREITAQATPIFRARQRTPQEEKGLYQ